MTNDEKNVECPNGKKLRGFVIRLSTFVISANLTFVSLKRRYYLSR
jgi:hypothetical protein